MTDPIILASQSQARQAMLTAAGVAFTSQTARVDETAIKQALLAEGAKPRDIADALAELKALRVSAKMPGAWVIGSDQVLDLKGKLLSKPKDLAAAREQLCQLRGQAHKLFSAAVIVKDGQPVWRHVGQVRLTMREFSDRFLEEYLTRQGDDIFGTVGAYKLEGEGVRLFNQIEGDYFAVLGMPLLEVLNYLSQTGALPK